MSSTLVMSVAVLGAVGVSPGAVSPEAKHTNSAKLAMPLKEAWDDLKAKRYADAISKLKAAENLESKTPYDQHLINDFLSFAYVKTPDYADAAKSLETEVDDGFLAQSEIPAKVRELANVNYQIKNYDKAIDFGNRAIKGGFANEDVRTIVGQAYYLKGDWKGTLKFEVGIADNQINAGETPKAETLQLILSACLKLYDSDCTTRALERLVQYYPRETPSWHLVNGDSGTSLSNRRVIRYLDPCDLDLGLYDAERHGREGNRTSRSDNGAAGDPESVCAARGRAH